ncbi:MAG: competence/damage-inducible protein A [Acidimicrobiia bacterium]|nr:competence/damage-inducible protein A [Acidimicrobiia bacterium]
MRCEVVAVGSELLLGQINDTNSSWIGQELAAVGLDSYFQTKVGDNLDRMVSVIELALRRSDAVICTGGLGPTQDDITRDAIAAVMGVELELDAELVTKIESMFALRGRDMPANNRLQARIPVGADAIPIQPGTAPGIVAEFEFEGTTKVIYAVPGVPWEMQDMMKGFIIDDLVRRSGTTSIIRSRTLRTWGSSESGLAETLADEIERLDSADGEQGGVTLAFLASGIEGLKVRITAKAPDEAAVNAMLDEQDRRVRDIIGPIVFAVDDETMESVILDMCTEQGLTIGTAESLTGGLIAQRLTATPGSSSAFRGGVITYATDVKRSLLNAPDGPSVSEEMVEAMALGACETLGTSVSVATTGVAGPDAWDGIPPGTVWIASCIEGVVESHLLRFRTDRNRIRQYTTITALDALRKRLVERAA